MGGTSAVQAPHRRGAGGLGAGLETVWGALVAAAARPASAPRPAPGARRLAPGACQKLCVHAARPPSLSPGAMAPCRCPGCNDTELAAHRAWLSLMGGHVKSLVSPSIKVLVSTEGFFEGVTPAPRPAAASGGLLFGLFGSAPPAPGAPRRARAARRAAPSPTRPGSPPARARLCQSALGESAPTPPQSAPPPLLPFLILDPQSRRRRRRRSAGKTPARARAARARTCCRCGQEFRVEGFKMATCGG